MDHLHVPLMCRDPVVGMSTERRKKNPQKKPRKYREKVETVDGHRFKSQLWLPQTVEGSTSQETLSFTVARFYGAALVLCLREREKDIKNSSADGGGCHIPSVSSSDGRGWHRAATRVDTEVSVEKWVQRWRVTVRSGTVWLDFFGWYCLN